MFQKILRAGALTALTTALTFAQYGGPHRMGPGGPMGGERGISFLTTALDLSSSQVTQATAIFDGAKTAAKALEPQLTAAHQALQAAVKSGASDTQINTLASTQGGLDGQMIAIHAKAQAQFYALLTPDQKTKLDALESSHGPRRGQGSNIAPPPGH